MRILLRVAGALAALSQSNKCAAWTIAATCAHGGSHNGRFGQLRVGRSSFSRLLVMNFDAIGALRGERNRNGHQLLIQCGDFTVLKRGLVEGRKSFLRSDIGRATPFG
jgi:hypothetical protein